jgi:hypothetical protein
MVLESGILIACLFCLQFRAGMSNYPPDRQIHQVK